jgi:sulfonate transport system permease protein
VLPGDAPKVALAALSVFFTTLIAVILGLKAADGSATEVIRSLGGTTWQTMAKIRLFAMLPSLFAGLKIAAPAALLGAIIGEYLGSSQGLGVMLVQAQSSFEVPRTWAIALVMSAIAGISYALVGLVGRLLIPWAAQDVTVSVGAISTAAQGGRRRSLFVSIAGLAGSLVIVLLGWYALIRGFNLNSYFAKTPVDVFQYLFTDAAASANRERLWSGLAITLGDAALGYVVGTIIAVIVALVVVTYSSVERIIMPGAIVLRSIPLVALTPLLALVFGRGLLGITIIVSLVTFFATLVNATAGLRSAPNLSIDVVTSLGGSVAFSTRKVRLLYALPSIFASARIAVPGALAGATLAEWLATGRGLGSMLISDFAGSHFDALWAESVVIVAVSVFFYSIIGAIEKPIIRRFGAAPIEH